MNISCSQSNITKIANSIKNWSEGLQNKKRNLGAKVVENKIKVVKIAQLKKFGRFKV